VQSSFGSSNPQGGTSQKPNNSTYNFNLSTTNTSTKSKQNNDDDDFKEVEEEGFKNGSNQQSKIGLNSLLDPKLVDLGDLKGNRNKPSQNNNQSNFNFY